MPDWRLTVVARESAADILQPDGFDFVFPPYYVERPPGALRPFHRYIPQRLVAWFTEPAMVLDLGPFDKVINLFWAWESEVPFAAWWTPQWPLQEGTRHTVDVLADYLERDLRIEIPPEQRLPRLQLFPDAADWVDGFLATEGLVDRPLVSLVVTAANPLKWWVGAKWAELNDRLHEKGWSTVLIAPGGDRHAAEIYSACASKPIWPELNLRQLSALLERSDLTVGIDTGPLHVSAALGTPWVGLYGATNPDVIGPVSSAPGRAIVARFPKRESCRDCWLAFKNREDECATLPATGCTTLIPVDQVVEAVEEVAGVTGTV